MEELLARKKELERQLAVLSDKKAREFIPGRGYVPHHRLIRHNGKLIDIFDLPNDQNVLNEIAEGKTETVFQMNTPSARMWLKEFDYEIEPGVKAFRTVDDLAAFTALDRPGPLDAKVGGEHGHNMLVEFANRAKGLPPTDPIPVLNELLPETYGIIVFQEQLQYVYQYLTGCTGSEAESFRRDIAKKKMDKVDAAYPHFIEKASAKVGRESAEKIWSQIKTFGQYGFNRSHALCYADTGYICAFLKHYYPLEWWCGVLKNADKNEISGTFWKYVGRYVDMPDIKLSGDNWKIVNGRLRAPLGFLGGVGAKAAEELVAGRPYTDIYDFVQRIEDTKQKNSYFCEKRQKMVKGRSSLNKGVIFRLILSGAMDSLFPEGLSETEKIDMFLEAQAAVTKKKKEPVPLEYLNVSPLERFQIRKSILPIYSASSEDLLRAAYHTENMEIEVQLDKDGKEVYIGRDRRGRGYRFVTGDQLKYLEGVKAQIDVAILAYVTSERKFRFGASKDRNAVSYNFEVDSQIFEYVSWGDKEGNIRTPTGITGAIVAVALSKWNEDKPFAINDIVVISEPLKT